MYNAHLVNHVWGTQPRAAKKFSGQCWIVGDFSLEKVSPGIMAQHNSKSLQDQNLKNVTAVPVILSPKKYLCIEAPKQKASMNCGSTTSPSQPTHYYTQGTKRVMGSNHACDTNQRGFCISTSSAINSTNEQPTRP